MGTVTTIKHLYIESRMIIRGIDYTKHISVGLYMTTGYGTLSDEISLDSRQTVMAGRVDQITSYNGTKRYSTIMTGKDDYTITATPLRQLNSFPIPAGFIPENAEVPF